MVELYLSRLGNDKTLEQFDLFVPSCLGCAPAWMSIPGVGAAYRMRKSCAGRYWQHKGFSALKIELSD